MSSTDQIPANPAIDTALIQLAWRYSLARTFEAGQTIFREGEEGACMLLVLAGEVRVLKNKGQSIQPQEIATRTAGSFLGEMALVDSSPRFATIVAATDCEVLVFSRENFEKVIREQPKLAISVLKSLSGKLRESDSARIAELEESNHLLVAANNELIRLNAFLDCVIDQSPSAIFLTTPGGDIFRCNGAAMTMFGIQTSESNTKVDSLFETFPFARILSSVESMWHGEAEGIRDGDRFPVYLSVTSLSGHSDSVLRLIICQDISELKTLNETIVQVEKYESERETAIELAHDVKNYMGVLIGSIELVIAMLTDDQRKKSSRFRDRIESTTSEIIQFLENMMIGRPPSGEPLWASLPEVCSALIRFCQSQARFQGTEFVLEVDPAFPARTLINEEQIRRAVLNLLINAAEACLSQDKCDQSRVALLLRPAPTADRFIIQVSDNGPGIPPKNVAKVFKTQFTTKANGHGIGLRSVSRIVRNQGGEVTVRSSPGETIFEIVLPSQEE